VATGAFVGRALRCTSRRFSIGLKQLTRAPFEYLDAYEVWDLTVRRRSRRGAQLVITPIPSRFLNATVTSGSYSCPFPLGLDVE